MDSASTGNKVISLTEFRSANTRDKCYVAIENKVYDVTEFLSQHPGGHAVLLQGGGKNVTEDFNTIRHSANAKELAESMRIGVLQDQEFTTARGDAPSSAITSTSSVRDTPVDSKDKQQSELKQRNELRRKINTGVKYVVGGAIIALVAGVVYYKWPQTKSAVDSATRKS